MYQPYTIKYKPINLNDIVGHENIIYNLKKLIDNNSLPHMLFYGGSGTGKTATVNALIEDLYKNNKQLMSLILYSYDDRGIKSVRETIKVFAEKEHMFVTGTRLVVLDQVDTMTAEAQFALRQIIEIYSCNIRFCLICNSIYKIIDAIKARCMLFHFNNISSKHIKLKLLDIINTENIKISNKSLIHIIKTSKGDLRNALNMLQQNINYNKINFIDLIKLPYLELISTIKQHYSIKELIDSILKYIINMPDSFIIELSSFEYLSRNNITDIHYAYISTLLHEYKDFFSKACSSSAELK